MPLTLLIDYVCESISKDSSDRASTREKIQDGLLESLGFDRDEPPPFSMNELQTARLLNLKPATLQAWRARSYKNRGARGYGAAFAGKEP